jgi:hypothetical protein
MCWLSGRFHHLTHLKSLCICTLIQTEPMWSMEWTNWNVPSRLVGCHLRFGFALNKKSLIDHIAFECTVVLFLFFFKLWLKPPALSPTID